MYSVDSRTISEGLLLNDVEESGRGLKLGLLSRHFGGWTEGNRENAVLIACPWPKFEHRIYRVRIRMAWHSSAMLSNSIRFIVEK